MVDLATEELDRLDCPRGFDKLGLLLCQRLDRLLLAWAHSAEASEPNGSRQNQPAGHNRGQDWTVDNHHRQCQHGLRPSTIVATRPSTTKSVIGRVALSATR